MLGTKDKRNVLVIVGREAEPPIMVDALRPRAEGTGFTLLVPATPLHGPDSPVDWADALDRAEKGAGALRDRRMMVKRRRTGTSYGKEEVPLKERLQVRHQRNPYSEGRLTYQPDSTRT